MTFGIIFGAWLCSRSGWGVVWIVFVVLLAMDVLTAIFWPDIGRDIGLGLAAFTRFIFGMEAT